MRAIQIEQPGGPEALRMVNLADPVPGPGQVRVKAHAIGVGRADVLIRQGTYKWMPPLPAIPGAELAGEIDALGAGVTQWKKGDRVLVSARELPQRGGCYAEAMVVPETAPYRLAASIGFSDAVNLPNLQLALALMRAGGAVEMENSPAVLITGASGGVATMLCQLARHMGFVTLGTSRSKDKQAFAKTQGFDHVLDASTGHLPDAVRALTDGRGVALAFDHLGAQSLVDCLHSLSPMGTVVSYNVVQGAPSEDVFQVLRALLGRSLAIRCFSMHTFDQHEGLRRGLMTSAIALMAQGHVKAPEPLCLRLDEVQKAHQLLDQGRASGKIVMLP